MESYDFDARLQKLFDENYSNIPPTNWKIWFDVSSKAEYESLTLKLSGLSSINNLFDRVKLEKTDPRLISICPESDMNFHHSSDPLVLCHTSGTSGGQLSDVKWFHISKNLVKRLWAPGMQAIFEASGLNDQSSALIFVPSRNLADGLSIADGTRSLKQIRLYSSEFSQRLMLSLIKPFSYLVDEYRNATTVQIIAKILSMENISVVSAPVSTILGWADRYRLREGLKKSTEKVESDDNPELNEILGMINRLGLDGSTLEIQGRLSDLLSDSTLVFSISSITESEWATIRRFMKWEKDFEKFTNLYVGSEIGPFAATINLGSRPSRKGTMYIFPLTLPVIEHEGRRDIINRTKDNIGRLLVSRLDGADPVVNIDTGDVVIIENQEGLPCIGGDVLRAGFRLKTKVVFSPDSKVPEGCDIYVGDYFNFEALKIVNPRRLLTSLIVECDIMKRSSMLIRPGLDDGTWVMIIPRGSKCPTVMDVRRILLNHPEGKATELAIQRNQLSLEIVDQTPVEIEALHSDFLKLVRNGLLPKGVLKRWPLYVTVPQNVTPALR